MNFFFSVPAMAPRTVRQPARDAGLARRAAIDGPIHPSFDGGVDRLLQGEPIEEPVRDIVGEVPAVAAVEESRTPISGHAVAWLMARMAIGQASAGSA